MGALLLAVRCGVQMAINFSRQVYNPIFAVFARPVTFTPLASQPDQPAYIGRGIYSTQPIDVLAEDTSIFSDTRTILDIIEVEFSVVPVQKDTLLIDAYADLPAIGSFEVIEVKSNGGGETSLSLRRLMETKP